MNTLDGRPIVAITNGDPAGIGPEIVVKALADPEVRQAAAAFVVGSPRLYERELQLLGLDLSLREIGDPSEVTGEPAALEVMEFDTLDLDACPRGEVSAEAGRYSAASIGKAIGLAMSDQAHSVVVAPYNKRAMRDAGHADTGFEEVSRLHTGAARSIQLLMGRRFNMARVTNHVALAQVPQLCTRARVLEAIQLLSVGLETIGLRNPRIGVSGLNPHNGEEGLMGTEEMTDIGPACDDAREQGLNVLGPLSADTVFVDYGKHGLDAVLSMYHDHGNGSMKLLEFGHLVNFIGGLPVPVFTVSHGTAFDIAGQGIADARNMRLSIVAAARARRPETVSN